MNCTRLGFLKGMLALPFAAAAASTLKFTGPVKPAAPAPSPIPALKAYGDCGLNGKWTWTNVASGPDMAGSFVGRFELFPPVTEAELKTWKIVDGYAVPPENYFMKIVGAGHSPAVLTQHVAETLT